MNYLPLLTLLGNVTSGSALASSHAYLDVPSNAHIFHKYYFHHYYYVYKEKYSFQDKVWIFDGRKNDNLNINAPSLFQGLFYDNKRDFVASSRYLHKHEHKNFVNWSVNGNSESLKDILKVNLAGSNNLFTPFDKSVHLEYSRIQKWVVDEYVFYSDGKSDDNKYNQINFGKIKEAPKVLDKAAHKGHKKTNCNYIRNNYVSEDYSFPTNEEGYDGVCNIMNIQHYNTHFMYRNAKAIRWTTPYVSYKYINKNNWNEQYYYFSLGDWVKDRGVSENLLKDSSRKAWKVNYDDVFALVYEGNKLHIKLNENSDVIKSLELSKTENNSKLSNFLLASSYLDFSLKFHHMGREITKKFTIKDVLDNKAFVSFQEGKNYFSSNFVLYAEPNNSSQVALGHSSPQEQKYYYKVNLDHLQENKKLFEKLHFDISGAQSLFPSELLDSKKVSKHFYLMNDQYHKIPLTSNLLSMLNIEGEVDDKLGTANLTYKLNGEVHKLNLSNMKKLPDMHGHIYAIDFKNAIRQLMDLYSDPSEYLWNNIHFSRKTNIKWDNHKTSLYLYFNPKLENSYSHGVSVNRNVSFDDLEIQILDLKDIFPVQKSSSSNYQDLSDLFEMNDYATSLNLGKKNYTYKLVGDNGDSFDVLASLHVPPNQKHLVPESQRKKLYTFDKNKFNAPISTLNKKNENKSWFSNPENIVIMSAGGVFSGSAAIALMRKLGWFKSKVI